MFGRPLKRRDGLDPCRQSTGAADRGYGDRHENTRIIRACLAVLSPESPSLRRRSQKQRCCVTPAGRSRPPCPLSSRQARWPEEFAPSSATETTSRMGPRGQATWQNPPADKDPHEAIKRQPRSRSRRPDATNTAIRRPPRSRLRCSDTTDTVMRRQSRAMPRRSYKSAVHLACAIQPHSRLAK